MQGRGAGRRAVRLMGPLNARHTHGAPPRPQTTQRTVRSSLIRSRAVKPHAEASRRPGDRLPEPQKGPRGGPLFARRRGHAQIGFSGETPTVFRPGGAANYPKGPEAPGCDQSEREWEAPRQTAGGGFRRARGPPAKLSPTKHKGAPRRTPPMHPLRGRAQQL